MKVLIIDTYYENFLDKFYENNIYLKDKNYVNNLNSLLNACFGTSDSYSYYLNRLDDVEAYDLIVNSNQLQIKWAKENKIKVNNLNFNLNYKLFRIPLLGKSLNKLSPLTNIALSQIKNIKADVVYIQNLSFFTEDILLEIKNHTKLLVGQIASPLPPLSFIRPYDLILTSFPHFVDQIKQIGINSEYFRIGFDERILDKIKNKKKDINFSFVGSISKNHSDALPLLEYLVDNNNLKIFGQGVKNLPLFSKIRKYHLGEKWGLDMYETLSRSKLSLNRHISTAKNYANNMRLFEATGMGSLLLTDHKENLHEIFDIDKEIITYKDDEEASDKAKYYLSHPNQLKKIALAGQERTLKDHTYKNRMKELNNILKKYL